MIRSLISFALFLTLRGQVSYSSEAGLIGIRLSVLSNTVSIVHPGTPAEEAGLMPGDHILSVDGDKNGEIIGEPDTVVHLVVKRGQEILSFNIIRRAKHSLPSH